MQAALGNRRDHGLAIASKSPAEVTQSPVHEGNGLHVCGRSNHVDNETFAIALHCQDGLGLIQYPGIAYCRDIAAEKFRAANRMSNPAASNKSNSMSYRRSVFPASA
jgi:hypothetical protein